MLLTNQKTINYENLSKKVKETTPLFFDDANIIQSIALLQRKFQL